MKKIFSFLILIFCLSCTKQEVLRQPKILVTIPPYAGFVKALVEEQAAVEVLVPPGSNPHTYEPTPEQIQRFTQTQVWFRTGDPIEQKIVQFLRPYRVEIINLSEGWATLDASGHKHAGHGHGHEEKDLHTWMDPLIAIEQVKKIAAVLSHHFKEIAPSIEKNSQKLIQQLAQADRDINAKLFPFRGQYLLVSHPALGYFCHRYGLHQLSVEIEGKDPLPKDIAKLLKKIESHSVPVMLIEPQYSNKGAILIAHQLHLPFEEIDPYAEDYFAMLDHLTQMIVKYYEPIP